jgi:threonine dehydratase
MSESIKTRKIIEMETLSTLSDATAGGIEPGAITFDMCHQLVDEYILVSEEEIKNAIISMIKTHHLLVEGSSGLALASLLKSARKFQGKNVVIVLSGANISLDTLKSLLVS